MTRSNPWHPSLGALYTPSMRFVVVLVVLLCSTPSFAQYVDFTDFQEFEEGQLIRVSTETHRFAGLYISHTGEAVTIETSKGNRTILLSAVEQVDKSALKVGLGIWCQTPNS